MRLLRQILRHLPIRFGARSDRHLRHTSGRHAQFASFLEQSGLRPHQVDRYERSLQRRQLVKVGLVGAATALVAWVVIESAQALTLF